MIKDLLGALGSWDVRLREDTPAEVLDLLDFFGHVAVVKGPADVQSLGDKMLAQARYVGVLRERSRDDVPSYGGVGMAVWAGDEDGKGEVIQEWVTITDQPLDAALYAVMPSAIQVGGIYNQPGKTYTGRHRFETPRDAFNTICAAFGVEWYISGEGKLYAGTTAQLYSTTPNTVVRRGATASDLDLTSLGAKFSAAADVNDYTTRVLLLGQAADFGPDPFITWVQDTPSPNRYVDMFGNGVKRTRVVSETYTTEGSIAARAQLQMNRFNRQNRSLKVTAEKYETEGNFRVGEFAYVYDPESGIFDTTREIVFRGEVLHPDVIRVTGISYPISEGHTVAYRKDANTWVDLTPWVVWETGTNEITVGDLPKSIGGATMNVARDRADAAQAGGNVTDTTKPAAPTGVQVSTSVIDTGKNGLVGQAQLSWDAVTANEDGTALNDFANYIIAYKLSTVSGWQYTYSYEPAATITVVPGRNYDFRVAAQDVNGNTSAYSATVSQLTAADNVPPAPPADPLVTSYYGQLRIEWNGKTSTGTAMPPDFNRVEVHVSATNGFTPSATTLVDSLVTGGVSYATAPYGVARYVKLIAIDNSGNVSTSSAQVTGTTVKVADGDIASMSVGRLTAGILAADITLSGRFTTALTGARTEMNAAGFYRFDASNNALVAIDSSGVLLTGKYRTALSGRRIEMGSTGFLSQIDFWSETTLRTFVRSYTESTGIEAIQIGAGEPILPGTQALDNRININFDPTKTPNTSYFGARFSTIQLTFGTTFSLFSSANSYGDSVFQLIGSSKNAQWNTGNFNVLGTGSFYATGSEVWFRVNPVANVPVDVRLKTDGTFWFDLGTAYFGGRIIFDKSSEAFSTSPRLQFYTSQNYGGFIRFNGGSGYSEFEFKNWDGGSFCNARASTFINNSDGTTKTDIVDAGIDYLSLIAGTKVKKYKRKVTRRDTEGEESTPNDLVEVGLIAQEAPAQIVIGEAGNLGIDLYQMNSLLWGAVAQLKDELDALKKGKK